MGGLLNQLEWSPTVHLKIQFDVQIIFAPQNNYYLNILHNLIKELL